jgi:tRNA A-37 threonylcarbamoyl transferase component Bud32
MALPLPQLDGKYEILEKLREGGMGAIYKVRHQLLDEVRVVKVMRAQVAEDLELAERFQREARSVIRLRHPNIAQLYDFSIDEHGTRYMVIEYIDGMSLQDVLEEVGPPPQALAVQLAVQSLQAIGYLHRFGMVHRDISPDNLMLSLDFDGQPLVKLIDLGIAKSQSEVRLTRTDTFLGKIRYAAPESFRVGSGNVDGRADLYAFGIVLYELLTGTSPIRGSDMSTMITSHLFDPPVPFEQSDPEGRVPEALRRAVLRALAKDPQERIPTAEVFAEEIAAGAPPSDRAALAAAAEQVLAVRRRPQLGLNRAPGSTQDGLDEVFRPHDESGPETRIEDLLAEAAGHLESRELDHARAVLRRARELDPGSPQVDELEARVRRRELDDERAREVAAAIAQARRLVADGRLGEARDVAQGLRDSGAPNGEVASLLSEIDQAQSRETRRLQVEALQERWHALLRAEAWEDASAELQRAQAELGDDDLVHGMWQELAQREQESRDRRFAAEVTAARSELDRSDADAAIRRLEGALELSPTDPSPAQHLLASARRLQVELEQEQARRREEEEHAVHAAQALIAAAAKHLALGELEEAIRALEVTGKGRLPPQLLEQIRSVEASIAEEQRRRAAAVAEAGLVQLLDAGDLVGARAALEAHERELGAEPFREHRVQLQRAEAAAREQQCLSWIEQARAALAADDLDSAAAALEAALQLEPRHATALQELRRVRGAIDARDREREELERQRAREESLRREIEEIESLRSRRRYTAALRRARTCAQRLDASADVAPLVAVLEQESALQRAQRLRRAGFAVAAVALVGLVVVGTVAILRLIPSGRDGGEASMGSLVVEAQPWAEVVAVVDAEGKRVFEGTQDFTPFLVRVPAGDYRVVLRSPDREVVEVPMQVQAGGTTRGSHRFESFQPRESAEALLDRLGYRESP